MTKLKTQFVTFETEVSLSDPEPTVCFLKTTDVLSILPLPLKKPSHKQISGNFFQYKSKLYNDIYSSFYHLQSVLRLSISLLKHQQFFLIKF